MKKRSVVAVLEYISKGTQHAPIRETVGTISPTKVSTIWVIGEVPDEGHPLEGAAGRYRVTIEEM